MGVDVMKSRHGTLLVVALALLGCGGQVADGDDSVTGAGGAGGASSAPAGTGGSGTGGASSTSDAGRPADARAADGPSAPAGDPTDYVFDEARLATLNITIAPADLAAMDNAFINNAMATKELEVPATVKVDDEDMGKVGIRYKGSYGTLYSCLANGMITCKKMSYKLDFGQFENKKLYHGVKKLNLHSLKADSTYLHERLAYKLYRQMGVLAPRSVHGKVYVNGEYKGVYALTEDVDGKFLDYRFPKGQAGGNMYKEAWPLSTDTKYYADHQHTNEGTVAPALIIQAAKEMNATAPADLTRVVGNWFNVDYMMKVFAVDRATTNWDGLFTFYCPGATGGCGNHNYYIYESQTENRLWFIPWDMDNTFQPFAWMIELLGPWDAPNPTCANNVLADWAWLKVPRCDRIINGLAGAGHDRFIAAVNQLLAGPFDVAKMRQDIDTWAAQISDGVKADMYGPGFMPWQGNVSSYKDTLQTLRDRMTALRDGMDASPFGLRTNVINDFETANKLSITLGTSTGTSANTTAMHMLENTGAIGGAADVRLTFELKNSSADAKGAFDQRAYVRLNVYGPNLNLQKLKTVRLKLRSDVTRPVRVEVGSGKYKPYTGRPPRFGWETTATAAGGTVTLDATKLAIPAGVTSPGDVLADIMSSVTIIYVIAQPVNRDATTGLMPAGASERGWLQVDDVELIAN
jgi:hypothetical protein